MTGPIPFSDELDKVLGAPSVSGPPLSEKPTNLGGELDAIMGEPDRALTDSMTQARQAKPDTHARVVRMQLRTGLPADVIGRNLEMVEQEAAKRDFDAATFRETSPLVAQWMQDPDHAKVAADDVENLSKLEWLFGKIGMVPAGQFGIPAPMRTVQGGPERAYRAGNAQIALAQLRMKQFTGTATPEEIAQADSLSAAGDAQDQNYGATSRAGKIAVAAATIAPTSIYALEKGARLGLLTGLATGGLAALAGGEGPQGAITVPAAALMGARVGFGVGAADATFGLETALAYDEMLKVRGVNGEKLDDTTAKVSSAVVGSANAIMETLSLGVLGRTIPGLSGILRSAEQRAARRLITPTLTRAATEFAKSYGEVWGTEVLTETIQEGFTIAGVEMSKQLSSGEFTPMTDEEVLTRLWQTGLQTAEGMLVVGLPGAGATFVHDAARARAAVRSQDAILALGETAKASKLRERLPEAFQDAVAAVTKDGPVENIYIPVEAWDTYFQGQKMDPGEVAGQVLGDVGQYFDAETMHGDLVIPLARYATMLAGTEHHAGLAKDVRLRQGDMTLRESEAFDEETAAKGGEIRKGAEGLTAPVSRETTVADNLTAQLQAAGVPEGEAAAGGAIYGSFIREFGARVGRDLAAKYKVTVGQAEAAPTGAMGQGAPQQFRAMQPTPDLPSESGFLYHATNEENAAEIAVSGLKTHRPSEFTDQEAWPDGGTEKRSYFSPKAGVVHSFAPEHGSAVILRVAQTAAPFRREGTGDPYSRKVIPASALEILSRDGKWHKLTEALARRRLTDLSPSEQVAALGPEHDTSRGTLDYTGPERRAPSSGLTPSEILARHPDGDTSRGTGPEISDAERAGRTLNQGPIQTDSPEFRAWFGKSQVVDDDGQPLVVYHGASKAGFTEFHSDRNSKVPDAFFFAGDRPTAQGYSGTQRKDEVTFKQEDGEDIADRERGVYSVYLKIENPFEWDFEGANWDGTGAEPRYNLLDKDEDILDTVYSKREADEAVQKGEAASYQVETELFNTTDMVVREAIKYGHDGAIIRNVRDPGPESSGYDDPTDIYVVFSNEQIKSATGNRGTFSPTDPNILHQGGIGAPGPQLSAVHQLSAENLAFADKMGGIAVPSVAVVPEGTGALQGYGDITLIGDRALADPEQNPVFDADAYTSRFPRPEYAKAKQAKAQALVDKFRAVAKEFDDRSLVDELWDNAINRPDPSRSISQMLRSDAAKALFLREHGVTVNPVMGPAQLEEPWVAMPAFQAYVAAHPDWDQIAYDDTAARKEMADAVLKAIDEQVASETDDTELRGDLRDSSIHAIFDAAPTEGGLVSFGKAFRISRSLDKVGTEQVRGSETEDAIAPLMQGREVEFKQWVEDQVLSIHGEPKLTVNRRKVAYTLPNIVEKMIEGRQVKGREETMTFGEGMARAASSVQFTDLEQMREAASKAVRPQEEIDTAREKAKALMEEYRSAVLNHYTETDYKGNVDTWRGLDASMKAIARWATGKVRGQHELAQALKREGFRGVPAATVKQGVEAGWAFLDAPVPYFEAKPQRAVTLSEFPGAAIPDDASAETRAILERAGVQVQEYKKGDEADRTRAINELRDTLAKAGKDVLFQNANRGYIQIAGQQFHIGLLPTADRSTFLHELTYLFFTVLEAEAPTAPQQVKDDLQIFRAAVGNKGEPFTREQHETLARLGEGYMLEGKAPSAELRSAFSRFKQWLVALYRDLRGLDVTLTDDVRSAFDRLLASDEEIAQAKVAQRYAPLSREDMGATEAEYTAYRKAADRATESAESELFKELLADETRATEEERVRKEVKAKLEADPAYQAIHYLKNGTLFSGATFEGEHHKLFREILVARYGEDILARMPDKTVAARSGADPDQVAGLFQFQSGDDLVQALIAKQNAPLAAEIERQTADRMRQSDLLRDKDRLGQAAQDAIHRSPQADVLLTELRLLGRQAGIRLPPRIDALRREARTLVEKQRMRDLNPYSYQQSEAKAARLGDQARSKGAVREAREWKRKQLLNHLAYRVARDLKDESERAASYLQGRTSDKVRAKLGLAGSSYLDAQDGLLDRFEFRTRTLKSIDRGSNLAAWITEQENLGLVPVISDALRDEAFRTNWKNLTPSQLFDLRDAVKNIAHLAGLKNKLTEINEARELAKVTSDIGASVAANATKTIPAHFGEKSPFGKAQDGGAAFLAWHHRLGTDVRLMDGDKDNGPMFRFWLTMINKAQNAEAVRLNKEGQATHDLLEQHYSKQERAEMSGWFPKREIIPGAESAGMMTKWTRLMVAMNVGTEDNLTKLLDGATQFVPDEQTLQAILDSLDERDWRFVQATWKQINSYQKEISALYERLTGLTMELVEGRTVPTRFGDIQGYYFPIDYDASQDAASYAHQIAADADLLKHGAAIRSRTSDGFTKARVESSGKPLKLSPNILYRHQQDVIHYLTHQEMLFDANRIIRDPAVSGPIRKHYGEAFYRAMTQTLTDIAAGGAGSEQYESGFTHVRMGVQASMLGYNAVTVAMQPLGITDAIPRLGAKYVGYGVANLFKGGPAGVDDVAAWIQRESQFMNQRPNNIGRDMSTALNKMRKQGKFDAMQAAALSMIGRAQWIADRVIWLGAYQKSADEQTAATHEERVLVADQAVRDIAGGGLLVDQAGVERSRPIVKLLTTFMSYSLTKLQQNRELLARTDIHSPASMVKFLIDGVILNIVPIVLAGLVRAAMRGELPDPEDLARDFVASWFGMFIGARELTGPIQTGHGTGNILGDYEGPAGLRIIPATVDLVKQSAQLEADAAFWKALNMEGGLLFHYPALQLQRTAQGFDALMSGTTQNPTVLLGGPPYKR